VRIANRDHPDIHIIPGDTVVISATAIPGNESLVARTIDSLFKQGARVLYDKIAAVHVHGHASQEELKLMLNLVKPRFFIPIHGEYRHLCLHANLARSLGIPEDNIFVLEDGDVLELSPEKGRVIGKVASGNIYVDGLGVGDVGHVILRDRKELSRDGVMVVIITMDKQTSKIVGRPELISRGFIDDTEFGGLIEQGREVVMKALAEGGSHTPEWGFVNTKVKSTLGKFLYKETKRRPMILPVVVKI
jgi:ribonuclease J